MLSLRRLRYFLFLARELHYGRAAHLLHIAQPALSQQIQALENELGAVLFTRNRRGVSLTLAAEALLPYAEKIADLAETAVASVHQAKGAQRSVIRVAFTRSALQPIVSTLIEQFQERHPNTYVQLRSGWTSLNFDDLLHGRIDVAFVRPLIRHPQIKGVEVSRERLVLAVHHDHPLARSEQVTVAAIRPYPFIVLPGQYELFRQQLWVEGPPTVSGEEPDEAHALMAVAKGRGIFVLPEAWGTTLHINGVIIKSFVAPQPEISLLVAFNSEMATEVVMNFVNFAHSMRELTPSVAVG
jgi:DNA-binding transcriptional LysR family regulator